jgi:hypothetical protein
MTLAAARRSRHGHGAACLRPRRHKSASLNRVRTSPLSIDARVRLTGNRQNRPIRRLEGYMLDLDNHQGRYGEHFARLIATTAGYTCFKPEDTGDGIDLVITHTQHDGVTYRPPNIELQIKTVRLASIVAGGTELSYDLEIPHYNALRAPGPTRRYLVVVIVPGDKPHDWYEEGPDFTVFKRAAYWRDLLNAPDTTNTTKIAVRIPLANRYTPEVVRDHMSAARKAFLAQFGQAGEQ